jgi:hypothetical protein
MKRLMIFALAVVAVLAGATTMLRSHPHEAALVENAAAMMSMQDMHAVGSRQSLPEQDFEDMSLVYPTTPRR